MKRVFVAIGLGVVGVAFALGLTVGALAVAGPDVGEPPTVPVLDRAGDPSSTPSPSMSNREKGGNGDDDRSNGHGAEPGSPKPTDSPSSTSSDDRPGSSDDRSGDDSGSEDHGSGSDEDSGSEDHESDSDHEGPDDD